MKLLVLGKEGQLGAELMARSQDAVGFTRGALDVTQEGAVEAALDSIRPDWLVNTTARNAVPDSNRAADLAFRVHAVAVQAMAQACRGRGIGFVTYSTDYVFDGRNGRPCLEDDRPNPLQTYGVSKYSGELLSALFHPGSLILRSCGVFGGITGSREKNGNFVLNILRQSEHKEEIEVSSEQIVNPTYAGDLAAATLSLLRKGPPGGIYHLAAEGHCSWAEFAAETLKLSGRSARIIPVDHGGRSGSLQRPLFSALANTKAKALGVTLPHWKDGLREYISWLHAHMTSRES